MSKLAPVISWVPQMSVVGLLQRWSRCEVSAESASLRRMHFPLQRGYTRLPFELSATAFRRTLALLLGQTADPARSVLVCTSSFWAPVAALWPGAVIYYATDLTFAYDGLSPRHVLAADRDMCRIANLVCPNSARLANFFIEQAGCPANRIAVLPNATRAANLREGDFDELGPLPGDVAHLRRPIAGVIGNMGNNIDWPLVRSAMRAAPMYQWLFIGPESDGAIDERNRSARAEVKKMAQAHFAGPRPYADLFRYARAVDVAVMPYKQVEPTYSGSATRFYEHLAAGRPMLATRGVEELLHKEPLLTLVDSAAHMAAELCRLLEWPVDGFEEARCIASRTETWEARSCAMFSTLKARWTGVAGTLGWTESAGDGRVRYETSDSATSRSGCWKVSA